MDTTLSDFVADLRAATPSAAAELVSSDSEELLKKVAMLSVRLNNAMSKNNTFFAQRYSHLQHRLLHVHPEQQLQFQQQKADDLHLRLIKVINRIIVQAQHQPAQLQHRLNRLSPSKTIAEMQQRTEQMIQRLTSAKQNTIQHKRELFVHLIEQLQLVSPLATIARGYSVIRDDKQKVISSITQLTPNDQISIQVTDGEIKAKVL